MQETSPLTSMLAAAASMRSLLSPRSQVPVSHDRASLQFRLAAANFLLRVLQPPLPYYWLIGVTAQLSQLSWVLSWITCFPICITTQHVSLWGKVLSVDS